MVWDLGSKTAVFFLSLLLLNVVAQTKKNMNILNCYGVCDDLSFKFT